MIFDVDGTYVDSVDLHDEASAFGFEFDLIEVRSEIGKDGGR